MNEITFKSKSTILSDVEIVGSISFKGELDFDGKLKKGSITGDSLSVGKNAVIKGNIMADVLTLSGKATGNVTVMHKCELGASAELTGDLNALQLAMEEGATLIGQVRLGPDSDRSKAGGGETDLTVQ